MLGFAAGLCGTLTLLGAGLVREGDQDLVWRESEGLELKSEVWKVEVSCGLGGRKLDGGRRRRMERAMERGMEKEKENKTKEKK